MQQTWWSRHGASFALGTLLVFLALPVWAFFSLRGLSFSVVFSGTGSEMARRMFPLFGLLAFTLVWFQILLGANSWWLLRRIPRLLRIHIIEGTIAFCFAVLHPFLLLLGFGLADFLQKTFVVPSLRIYTTIGTIQLTLLAVTVASGLLRRSSLLRRHWRSIHLLNYVIFILIWVHSWFLGTDVQTTNLRYLWFFFAGTVAVSAIGRLVHFAHIQRRSMQTPNLPTTPPPPPSSSIS